MRSADTPVTDMPKQFGYYLGQILRQIWITFS